jgi:two-component system, chemotaxis family, sensor kinase CheA
MDVQRYLDLYIAETHEHVRLLQRSLVDIEVRPGSASVDEAFRAAHTLKSLSAAMGFEPVADAAHRLEDVLAGLRDGRITASSALIDELLAQADAIEAGISGVVGQANAAFDFALAPGEAVAPAGDESPTSAQQPATPRVRDASPSTDAAPAAATLPVPDGTVRVLHVRLREDAPLKAVRALLVMRALDGLHVIGSDPAEFDDSFAGEFRIFIAEAADAEPACAAVRAAGEVEAVDVVEVGMSSPRGDAATDQQAPAKTAAQAATGRQLRVDAARLDSVGDGIGELAVLFSRLDGHAVESAGLSDVVDRMAAVLSELQHDLMKLRTVPVRHAFERLPRVVRDAARSLGREVDLVMSGEDVELDRGIVDEITEPLMHLLRNAVAHGIEPPEERRAAGKRAQGRVELRAERDRSAVRIVVRDDGRGVQAEPIIERAREVGLLPPDALPWADDEELFRLLSHPGLSTATHVSAVSGRGVGMDVVVSRIRALGGSIDMKTHMWAGTTFTIRLPISLALTQALRVRVGADHYVIPLTHISEVVELGASDYGSVEVRGEPIPLISLRSLLSARSASREQAAVVTGTALRQAALAVDELIGREQILVRALDTARGLLPHFSGATLLADGRPALVLDPLSVI